MKTGTLTQKTIDTNMGILGAIQNVIANIGNKPDTKDGFEDDTTRSMVIKDLSEAFYNLQVCH